MDRKYIWIPALFLVSLALGRALWSGFQNEKDNDWFALDESIRRDYFTLDQAVDSLQGKYNLFHGAKASDDSLAYKILARPFLPTMEYSKFSRYFDLVSNRRFVTISGVAGSGNSTIVDRIAGLIGQSDHRINILCAPQYEMEYHRRYIGYFDLQNKFVKGELLRFWDKCKLSPKEKFVCMIDNFDKIDPETVFGAELWWKLDDPRYTVAFGKDTIDIPENFYLVNVTHAIAGARVELNNEHFKRFGGLVNLPVCEEELILFLRGERLRLLREAAKMKGGPADPKITARLSALQDTPNIKRMVYFFDKANDLIEQKYSKAHQLGQWSEARKLYLPENYASLQNLFLAQVNAFRPSPELKKEDFDGIDYTAAHNGAIKNTYFLYKAYLQMASLGFVSEFGVALVVGLIGAVSGWFIIRKKHAEMRRFTSRIYQLMEDFEARTKEIDDVHNELKNVKHEFDDLVGRQKISYTDASFFYGFIDDKIRNVEVSKEVNASFLHLVDVFLEDSRLTDSEYRKLSQFIESIKNRISTAQYVHYKGEIEKIYQEYGAQPARIDVP